MMKTANLSFINEPYYIISVPEYKDEHSLDLHLFRYDIPGKGWRAMNLRYSKEGIIPVKEASNTSYAVVQHVDPKATFTPIEDKVINVERNFFQIKDETILDNVKSLILTDINKMVQNKFTYKIYSLEEVEELLVSDNSDLAKATLEAFRDAKDSSQKRNIASYYLLYTSGGVYMDCKSLLKRSLEDTFFRLNLYDGFIGLYETSSGAPDSSFIACKKGSKLLKATLTKAIENVKNRFYGSSPQEPTGYLCFKEITGKLMTTMRDLRYEDEKYFILKEETGRLYDDNNKLVWNRDVFINMLDKKATPNLWLHCGLYSDGNCSNFGNWKFYLNESPQTQSAIFVLLILVFAVVAFYLFSLFFPLA